MDDVGTAADGFEATMVACRDRCRAAGRWLLYFGLGCPKATGTICNCYKASHLRQNGFDVHRGIAAANVTSCANPLGACTNTDRLESGGNTYHFGGANFAAIYARGDG